jgi:hypothetical protein
MAMRKFQTIVVFSEMVLSIEISSLGWICEWTKSIEGKAIIF